MTITLARHGEVETPFLGRYNGHNDIGLSETGRKQARALGRHLAGESFDALYCSDLRRCTETMEIIIQHSTVNSQHRITTPTLREKSWGRHEGKTFGEIIAEEGMRYENFLQWIGMLDGEPYGDYIARIRRFFLEELAAQPYEHVFIMTHAGVIRVLMHLLQGIPLEEAFGTPFPYGACTALDLETRRFGETVCVA